MVRNFVCDLFLHLRYCGREMVSAPHGVGHMVVYIRGQVVDVNRLGVLYSGPELRSRPRQARLSRLHRHRRAVW